MNISTTFSSYVSSKTDLVANLVQVCRANLTVSCYAPSVWIQGYLKKKQSCSASLAKPGQARCLLVGTSTTMFITARGSTYLIQRIRMPRVIT